MVDSIIFQIIGIFLLDASYFPIFRKHRLVFDFLILLSAICFTIIYFITPDLEILLLNQFVMITLILKSIIIGYKEKIDLIEVK